MDSWKREWLNCLTFTAYLNISYGIHSSKQYSWGYGLGELSETFSAKLWAVLVERQACVLGLGWNLGGGVMANIFPVSACWFGTKRATALEAEELFFLIWDVFLLLWARRRPNGGSLFIYPITQMFTWHVLYTGHCCRGWGCQDMVLNWTCSQSNRDE